VQPCGAGTRACRGGVGPRNGSSSGKRLLPRQLAQENLIKASSIPYSIVRATQFFEFVKQIADFSTAGNQVRLPFALFQPMAADDVAGAVARVAMGSPVNGTVEIGGPEQFRLDELARRDLAARRDPRTVITDPQAGYYGIQVSERALVPDKNAQLAEPYFQDRLNMATKQAPKTAQQPA
jgi:uncharacterized protein YbjT (DUF2867 family)